MFRSALILVAVLAGGPALAQDLSSVGRLAVQDADRAPSCTGTLIGPRQVLTARHCAGRAEATGQRFFVGWTADGSDEILGVVAAMRGGGVEGDFATDYAILTLDRDAGPRPLPLAPAPPVDGRVRVVSYPWGQGHARRDRACTVLELQDRLMLLGCPAQGGMSGAPVLVARDGGWAVAGVVVARMGRTASIAVRLDTATLPGLPPVGRNPLLSDPAIGHTGRTE